MAYCARLCCFVQSLLKGKQSVLYCTVLYCTVLYCTVLYCTVLYCTVLYCRLHAFHSVLYCVLHYITTITITITITIFCKALHHFHMPFNTHHHKPTTLIKYFRISSKLIKHKYAELPQPQCYPCNAFLLAFCSAAVQCFLIARYIPVLYHCDMVYCAVLDSALCAMADTYLPCGLYC